VKLLKTGQHWDQKYWWFRGVAGFMRLPLKELFSRDLKNWLIFREGQIYEGPV
jgi:hypothetical protein